MRACVDATLTAAIRAGRLRVGDKLLVSAATRGGSDVPSPPLEGYNSSWLCVGANGARRPASERGASQRKDIERIAARATHWLCSRS